MSLEKISPGMSARQASIAHQNRTFHLPLRSRTEPEKKGIGNERTRGKFGKSSDARSDEEILTLSHTFTL